MKHRGIKGSLRDRGIIFTVSGLPGRIYKKILILSIFYMLIAPLSLRPDVTIDFLLGFNGITRLGKWSPISIMLRNTGKTIKGDLKLEVLYGSSYSQEMVTTTYRRKIDMPKNSRKRYSFVIPLKSYVLPLTVKIETAGRQVVRREIDLREYFTMDRLILALSRDVSLDFLTRLSKKGSRVRVIYPHLEHLPDKWNGYDGIDLIIIHDISLTQIRPAQVRAIEQWVYRGGRLVISGGVHLMSRDNSVIRDLLPVEPVGLKVLEQLDPLIEFYGGKFNYTASPVITESHLISGKVLLEAGNIPLLVEQQRGKGTIVFMAFNPSAQPFSSWEGKFALWHDFLGEAAETNLQSVDINHRDLSSEELIHSVLSLPIITYPSHALLFGFLLGFLGLLFILSSSRPSRNLNIKVKWIVMFCVSLLFSLSGYYLFNHMFSKNEAAFLSLSRIELPWRGRYGELTKDMAVIFSREKSCRITVSGKENAVLQIIPDEKLKPIYDFEIQEEDRGISITAPRTGLRARYFTITSMVEFPIHGKIRSPGESIELELTNNSEYPISESVLIHRGRAYWLGNFSPGSTLKRTIADLPGDRDKEPDLTTALKEVYKSRKTKAFDLLLKEAMLMALTGKHYPYPTLIGWLSNPVLKLNPGRDFLNRITQTLIIMEIPNPEVGE